MLSRALKMIEGTDSVQDAVASLSDIVVSYDNIVHEFRKAQLAQGFTAREQASYFGLNWYGIGDSEYRQVMDRNELLRMIKVLRLQSGYLSLPKRAVSLRGSFIFGQGLKIRAADASLYGVLDNFWYSMQAWDALTSPESIVSLERTLNTDGNVFLLLSTDLKTRSVRPVHVVFENIPFVIYDSVNTSVPVYYVRSYVRGDTEYLVAHPTLQMYWHSAKRVKTVTTPETEALGAGPVPVDWNTPIVHMRPNTLTSKETWGVPDLMAGADYAVGYDDLIRAWLVDMLSILSINLHAQAPAHGIDQVQSAVQDLGNTTPPAGMDFGAGNMGSALVTTEQIKVALMNRQNTIVSDSIGRPLASAFSGSVDLVLTDLIGDPGQTGARAVAETMKQPNNIGIENRQRIIGSFLRKVLAHVVAVVTGRMLDLRSVSVLWPSLQDNSLGAQADMLSKISAMKHEEGAIMDEETLKMAANDVLKIAEGNWY